MLLGVPVRLHGLGDRADLIRLEDEALDSALLMRPLEQRGICDRQIVADEQRTGELLCRDLVTSQSFSSRTSSPKRNGYCSVSFLT